MRLSARAVDDERAPVGLAVELERRGAGLVAQRQLQVQLDELAGDETLRPRLERPRLAAGVDDPKRLRRADLHGRPALGEQHAHGAGGHDAQLRAACSSASGSAGSPSPRARSRRRRTGSSRRRGPSRGRRSGRACRHRQPGRGRALHDHDGHDDEKEAAHRAAQRTTGLGAIPSPEWRSNGSWWRIAARSPSGSSARAASSGSEPSR